MFKPWRHIGRVHFQLDSFITSAQVRGDWPTYPTLPIDLFTQGKEPRSPLKKIVDNPQCRQDFSEKRNILAPLKFEPRIFKPIAQSPCQLRSLGTSFIIISLFNFIQNICNYVADKNVSVLCNVAATVWLQFIVHLMLFPMINVWYFYINNFRSVYALPNMAVFFCS